MDQQLSDEEVLKVARLARIELSTEEVAHLGSQLSKLLQYVEILQEVETSEVEPMVHAIEQTNVFRDDQPRIPQSRDDALANAPQTDGKYFQVPAILDPN